MGFRLTNGVCKIQRCVYFTPKGCSLCEGDWVAGTQTSPSGETLGFVYESVSDQPELWINVEVAR